jgi:hypothetical protein
MSVRNRPLSAETWIENAHLNDNLSCLGMPRFACFVSILVFSSLPIEIHWNLWTTDDHTRPLYVSIGLVCQSMKNHWCLDFQWYHWKWPFDFRWHHWKSKGSIESIDIGSFSCLGTPGSYFKVDLWPHKFEASLCLHQEVSKPWVSCLHVTPTR